MLFCVKIYADVSADDVCETETLGSDITIASSDKQSWSQPLIFY